MARNSKTRLDSSTEKPATTEPGDAPADTTDPNERAVSAPTNPGDEAVAEGTVNAVKPAPKQEAPAREGKDRTEEYEAVKPDGSKVTVSRNIETGETTVK